MTNPMHRKTIQFELTEDHITLLQAMNIRWDSAMFGAPAGDTKRPFGSSGSGVIRREICDMLGYEPVTTDEFDHPVYDNDDEDAALETYRECDTALQIVLSCQTFEPGVFEKQEYTRDWERVAVEHGDECPGCGAEVSTAVAGMFGEWHCNACGVKQWVSQ